MINTTNLAIEINNEIYKKDYTINNKIDISTLDEKYQKDIWDISNWEEYKDWTKNDKSDRCIKNIKFNIINNSNVKNEMKFFIYTIVTRKNISLATIRQYTGVIPYINEFLQRINIELNSLLEIKIDKIEQDIKNNYDKKLNNLNKFLNAYFNCYKEKYNLIPKFNKYDDIWNLDYIGFKVNTIETSPIHTIDFSTLTIPDIKKAAQTVFYHFLKNKSISTIKGYRLGFHHLNDFLLEKSKIINLKDLNRETIEEFIYYIRGIMDPSSMNCLISGLNICFETLRLLDYPMPNKKLFYKSDANKIIRKESVDILSDNELKQINENLNQMTPINRNILFIFEQTGTRISETLMLEKDCLIIREKENGESLYSLKYKQYKTSKYNYIPIDDLTAEVIKNQIKLTKEEFGEDFKYIFTQDGTSPIRYMTFKRAFEKLINDNNILSDNGTPLSKKTHQFRATKATSLANRGISYDTIRLILGHANLNSLYHYIKIHSKTMSDFLKPLFDEMTYNYENRHSNLKNDVNMTKQEMLEQIPLVNGMCCKNPLEGCEHSNICYTCDFFKGNANYLNVYENQLSNAKNNLEMAKLNNFTRIIEQNETLITSLEKIIKEIKGE